MTAGTITIGGEVEVRRLGFGAMRITGPEIWGPPRDRAEALRVLRRAVELGVDFIDTADSYGPEVSEQLIAEALYPYPDGLVIGTKGGHGHPSPDVWTTDCRPQHLRQACEDSPTRLRLDRIDLYQLHTIDPNVPLEDSLGALADLRAGGQDPPHRRLQLLGRGARTGGEGGERRLGPEPLRPRGSSLGGRAPDL